MHDERSFDPSHDEALAQWLAEEKAVRARLRPEHGVATMAEIAGLNGLQQMQAMLDGKPRRRRSHRRWTSRC